MADHAPPPPAPLPLSDLMLDWDWNSYIDRIVYYFETGWFFNETRVAFCHWTKFQGYWKIQLFWAPSYDLCNCDWWEGVWGRSNLPQKKFNSPFWTKVWTHSPNKKFLDPLPQWQPWAAVSPSLGASTVHRYWDSFWLLLFFKPLSSLSNSIPPCSLWSLLEIYMQCIIHSWQVLIIWIMRTGVAWPVQILCNNSSLTTLFGHSLACTVVVF